MNSFLQTRCDTWSHVHIGPLLAVFDHLCHHLIEVLSMLSSVRIIAQAHLQVESVHRDWAVYQAFNLVEHVLQEVEIEVKLSNHIVCLLVLEGIADEL